MPAPGRKTATPTNALRAATPARARALVYDGTNAALHAHRDCGAPGAGQALVRMLKVGIASPDVAVLGGKASFTGVLGHLGVGVVEAIGPTPVGQTGDDRALIGKRVAISPQVACGGCDRCKSGLSRHCPHRKVLGMHGHDGLFADAAIVPTGNLIGVPRAVSDEQAAFAAVVAGALHCCAMVRVEGKTYITVLGDGPVGLLAARALQKRNASVRVLGRHPEKLALCEKWGLKSRHIGEVGRHQDQDIVIDCTGSPLGTELATHLVRPRGTVIVKGWPAPARSLSGGSARVNLSHALANELTLQGAREGSLVEALAAMADGHLDPTPLISRRGALAEWQGAFAAASDPLALLVSMTV